MTLCGWNGPSSAGSAGPSSRPLMAKAAAAAPAMEEARLTARHATNHRTHGVMASPRSCFGHPRRDPVAPTTAASPAAGIAPMLTAPVQPRPRTPHGFAHGMTAPKAGYHLRQPAAPNLAPQPG
jgi:hypothetical protein